MNRNKNQLRIRPGQRGAGSGPVPRGTGLEDAVARRGPAPGLAPGDREPGAAEGRGAHRPGAVTWPGPRRRRWPVRARCRPGRSVRPVETVEDQVTVGVGDARARVVDRQHDPAAPTVPRRPRRCRPDRRTCRRCRPAPSTSRSTPSASARIRAGPGRAAPGGQRDRRRRRPPPGSGRPAGGDRPPPRRPPSVRPRVGLRPVGPGQPQQVVDDGPEPVALRGDPLERRPGTRRRSRGRASARSTSASMTLSGRAQLVAGVGGELGLAPPDLFDGGRGPQADDERAGEGHEQEQRAEHHLHDQELAPGLVDPGHALARHQPAARRRDGGEAEGRARPTARVTEPSARCGCGSGGCRHGQCGHGAVGADPPDERRGRRRGRRRSAAATPAVAAPVAGVEASVAQPAVDVLVEPAEQDAD